MKIRNQISKIGLLAVGIAFVVSAIVMSTAKAAGTSANTTNTNTATQQTLLNNILNKGNAEITRRLESLNSLTTKITSAKKLSSSDQSYLENEVSSELSGLTTLKSSLDACTLATCAVPFAQSIFNDYRVYALVLPKVHLVKMADDQQAIETSLTTLSQKLQSRITADQTAGKNVASLQTELNTMIADINAAQSISSNIESTVLPLQPSDYNSDHTILSGYAQQLQTARNDLQAAAAQAKTIITGLKSLG